MAPHSNTLAWKIPRMEESDRLQSMRSLSGSSVIRSVLKCEGEVSDVCEKERRKLLLICKMEKPVKTGSLWKLKKARKWILPQSL